MKLENCKVGMVVKVKSLEKCKELGYDEHFGSNFCGKKVNIKSIKNGLFFDETPMDFCDVELKNKKIIHIYSLFQ